jgi:hypothetical protein
MKPNYVFILALGSAICAAPTTLAKPGSGGGNAAERGGGPADNPSMSRPLPPAPATDRAPGNSERVTPPSTHPTHSAKPAAQQLSGSMHDINRTAFAQRRELLDNVDLRLQSSRDALKQIQAEAKQSRIDARADFKAALADVKAREKALNAAVKASRKANEASWEARRMELARKSQDFTDAMDRLEAARLTPTS